MIRGVAAGAAGVRSRAPAHATLDSDPPYPSQGDPTYATTHSDLAAGAVDDHVRAYLAHRDRLLTIEGAETAAPTATESLHGHNIEAVAAHPDAPERAFVGTFDAGLFRTVDAGDSFEWIGDAIEHDANESHTKEADVDESDAIEHGANEGDAVTSVAVSPHDPEEVWIGTEPSRLYHSEDGGEQFERIDGLLEVPSADEWSFPPRPDTHHVRWIEPDSTDPERIYVGIEAGALLYTTDGGESWVDRPPGSRRDNHQLATHPDAEGRVYSAAGDGYAESSDGGESWAVRHDGLGHRYVWSVLPDPGDPDRVLVTAASGPRSAHSTPGESYCYRLAGDRRAGGDADRRASDTVERRKGGDGGAWERLEGPLSGEGVLRGVLATDGEPGHAYAATNRGCYRSTDFGDSWDRIDVDWPADLEERTARGLAVVNG